MKFPDMGVAVLTLLMLSLMVYTPPVYCEKHAIVKVGVVFTFDSVIGRAAKTAMEMAVQDVNADATILNGTELRLIMEDSSCNVFMGSIKAFQVIEKEVVAILGPQSSGIARIVSHIANGLQIPVLSYAATNPTLSSHQFPYFFRTAQPDSNQMAAIADIIDFYEWKQIIAVYVDNDYGRNAVSELGNFLAKKMARISYKLPLSPQYDHDEIFDVLNKSKSLGPRVYVVHIDPDPELKFFRIVKNLDMISNSYVWLATDWLSSTLDLFHRDVDNDAVQILQGLVMLRPYIPNTSKKKDFISRLRNSNFNVYGLYAYDTVWVIARSIDRFLKGGKKVTYSYRNDLQLGNVKIFDGGELLLDIISTTKFSGLTGQVQFDADKNLRNIGYEIINVVGDTTFKVGYWSNDTGLSVQSPVQIRRNENTSSHHDQKLDNITWPGGKFEKPRGWVVATVEKPLRVVFPKRASFTEVQGYCIDLFDEVLKMVPYEVPFRLEPFGDGLRNPNYDKLVRMVTDDIFDVAIGDIAIVTNRTRIVDFTQPFVATGLAIVAPVGHPSSSGWVFVKPFTLGMWCVTAVSFFIIAVVIWMFEHPVNDDFRGSPRRQLRTMFLFSFSTLYRGTPETTISTPGRMVMVVWLFLLLVIKSSYTASLSSILTVKQLSVSITGIDTLISSGLPIGYQVGSFAKSYMTNSLGIHPSRLVPLGTPEEYESAMQRGPTHGGVAAIVDEIPYIQLFLSKRTDFGIVGHTFTKSGWGFAVHKDSPLAVDMSTAILKLSESGELEKIHDKWLCGSGCPGKRSKNPDTNRLHLRNFLALYFVFGTFALAAFFVFLIRAVRQYIKYKMSQTNPSTSSSTSISLNVFVSNAIRNFIDFIDEKEEAIKRTFAQHDHPPAPVSSQ